MIYYSRRGPEVYDISSVSIAGSRLVALMTERVGEPRHLVIWDWKSAQLLFVCQFLFCPDNVAQPFDTHVGT